MTNPDTSKPPAWWPEGAKASMNPPERSEVTALLTALLLEAKKTTALLRLMAEQAGVEYWRVGDALEDAERQHQEEHQK